MFNNYNLTSDNNFLGQNADVQTQFDYNSFYRAQVMSIEDPDNLGRIKVRIPALHSSVQNASNYPYAYPACFTGLGNQVGQFILPPVGSYVFVTFEYSDEHRPIYFGGIPTQPYEGKEQFFGLHRNNGGARPVTERDIPLEYTGTQSIVLKSPDGAIIMTDDTDKWDRVLIQGQAGQKLLLASFTDEEGTKQKSASLAIDKNNFIRLAPNEITIKIDGQKYTLNKSNIDKLYNLIK